MYVLVSPHVYKKTGKQTIQNYTQVFTGFHENSDRQNINSIFLKLRIPEYLLSSFKGPRPPYNKVTFYRLHLNHFIRDDC